MIRLFIPSAIALCLAASASAQTPAVAPVAPKMTEAEIKSGSSFGFGYQLGNQYNGSGLLAEDMDAKALAEGFLSALSGKRIEKEQAETIQTSMQGLRSLVEAREKSLGDSNLEAGKKFLAENGKREGVVTTASGLQYEVITKGGDEKYVAPKEGEAQKQFKVHYKGTMISGKEFDASPAGEPVTMTLEVVPGFKEALTTMPVGAKWKLFVPADLAYGPQRRSADIGPNSTLIFELELVKIEEAPPAPKGMPFEMPAAE